MDYITVAEIAGKWNVSVRQIQRLLSENKIPDVKRHGHTWLIPADAKKPADARIKSGKYINTVTLPTGLAKSFQMLIKNPEFVFQMFDMFPFPIEIFAPDGTAVFLNRAFCEFNTIQDANLSTGIGEYNILKDPKLIEYRDVFQKAFSGEIVSSPLKPPIQDLVDRGFAQEKPFESADIDVHFYPVWDDDKLVYVISVYIIKNVYRGREEIAKAQEYMDQHWLDEFNRDKIAKAAHISGSHFSALFKQHTGETPLDYYKRIKVKKLQEKLLDPNLNIEQAFSACGVDYHGRFRQYFRDIVGQTPSQYREEKQE
jgi:excisionase family DNA binding protein